MTIIPKINCPKCKSSKLCKYGKDINGYQKYLCRDYNRQFSTTPKSNHLCYGKYPICFKCGKATFLHNNHKYNFNCSCCDKSETILFVCPNQLLLMSLHHIFFLVKPISRKLSPPIDLSASDEWQAYETDIVPIKY